MTPGGYAAPRTLQEAVALLASAPGARVLAGGQRLLVEPSRSRIGSTLLVDLRKIENLAGIERRQDRSLKIGAMTTLATIATSEPVQTLWPALSHASRESGDAQMRNRATVGGSVAAADPEADVPAVLLALDASIEVAASSGSRTLALKDLYTGAGQTSLRADDVITAVVIPARGDRSAAAYERFLHPATLGAICGIAARITLAKNGTVADARVAVTGAIDRPMRIGRAEEALSGQPPTDAVVEAAAAATKDAGSFLNDHFASAEYRRHLVGVLTARAVRCAIDDAAGRQR